MGLLLAIFFYVNLLGCLCLCILSNLFSLSCYSPEACAAILWKTAKAAPKAAEKLKITAKELCKLQIADGIIPEPLGGAHADPSWTSQQIKLAITEAMDELLKMDTPELLNHRMLKFRKLGGFQEGIPQDPIKKRNMKKKDAPIIRTEEVSKTPDLELEEEVEKLKQQILKSRESSSKTPKGITQMIKKLKKEIDLEVSEAVKAMGLKEKFEMLRKEFVKARSSPDELVDSSLKEKIEKLQKELDQGLSEAPNFASLNYKREMLKEMSKAKKVSEQNDKVILLKQEINKRFKQVMEERSDLKEKMESFEADIASARSASTDGDLDQGLKEKILKAKKEIELELADVLKSSNLDVEVVDSKMKDFISEQTSLPEFKLKAEKLNREIYGGIEGAIHTADIERKMELLKLEIAKKPTPESKSKIEALNQQIRKSIAEALSSSELIEKHKQLKTEIVETMNSSSRGLESNGSLNHDTLSGDQYEPRVEFNIGTTK
ncbi:hypothetical protein GIB67_013665 [Kingdonia uniflora]|uniref:acetyl-CoA carboxytransferase n=1 Tax=Kingdonia uniflora TaxID=39325 RepID=A0A7J7NPX0_9MAGN|nr:hypothetical protein GIB67_013665 [Kingdonia uniflora]